MFTDHGSITGYTAASLVKVYHYFKSHPDECYTFGQWPGEQMNFSQWRKWFVDCLNAKINRNETPRGKKDTPEYRRLLARDVSIIREYYTRRLRYSGRNILTTPEAKRRYPEIDNPPVDF